MLKISNFIKVILVLIAFQFGCTKLPQAPLEENVQIVEDLSTTDAIPHEWGNLVSTVISPDFPRRVQLWFQNEEGEIHLAFYEMDERRLAPKIVVFRRY